MEISKAQRVSIDAVVKYSKEDERAHCEELLYTTYDDVEFGNMSDKELYNFCVENGINHIWTSFYEISLIG
jgi:Cys-tRNA synthase (O-phospho-L-seryl-tRNA:Cys-tRNA synthase)